MRFLQTTMLLGLAVLAAAEEPSAGHFVEIPVMPRIPSQAKHMEILRARSAQFEPDTGAVVSTTCHNPAEFVTIQSCHFSARLRANRLSLQRHKRT